VKERKVAGIGIDTLGIDAGYASDFPVHKEVTHPAGIWHLENLQNLSLVPPVGSYIIVGVIPFVGGSGAPARVFALTY
jgi:kynurenine formamidase